MRTFGAIVVFLGLTLALSGCMGRRGPVAAVPVEAPVGQPGLDAMTYGGAAYGQPAPAYAQPAAVVAAPMAYAPVTPSSYLLDAGDKLRIVVYGQEGLTNTYAVDAGGAITMPLIGAVPARGLTPAQLSSAIAARLRNGYIREPYVAAEVESYRPFFILGEVAAPGQYPYVPNMTVESAVAIAGGFSPRAKKSAVKLTRSNEAGSVQAIVTPDTPLQPGDTVVVPERWF